MEGTGDARNTVGGIERGRLDGQHDGIDFLSEQRKTEHSHLHNKRKLPGVVFVVLRRR